MEDQPTIKTVTFVKGYRIETMSHGLFRLYSPSGEYLDSLTSTQEAREYVKELIQ